MTNDVIFENDDIVIRKTGKDYDFIATIENMTDRVINFCIPEFADEFSPEINSHDWVGVLADDVGYQILDCLEAGNFEYI